MDSNRKYKNLKEFNGIQDYLEYQRNSASKNYGIRSNFRYLKSDKDLDYSPPNSFVEIKKVDFTPLDAMPPKLEESTILKKYNSGKEEKIYTIESKLDAAAPSPEVEAVDIFTLRNSVENGRPISRLFSIEGLVYKFNRGLVMIDENGKKHEEILDFTRNHHADRVPQIATDVFGRVISYQGPSTELVEALELAPQGLVTMLFEGNKCIMIVPDNLTVEAIDEIISELEPRDDFIFSVARENGDCVENLSRDVVLDYYRDQKKKKERSNFIEEVSSTEQNEKLTVNDYIKELLNFLKENHISLIEYCRNIGRIHRKKDQTYLPEFERKNPFLDENDIQLLLESDDPMIIEYFARAMFRVINLNIANDKATRVTTSGEYKGEDPDSKKTESDKPTTPPKEQIPEKQVTSSENGKKPKENEKLSARDYINELLKYLEENNISLIEYYRNVGRIYRTKDNISLPEFEKKNPFIDEGDIRLLLESEEQMIVQYFARAMFRVINLNIAKDKEHKVTTSGEYKGETNPIEPDNHVVPSEEEFPEKKNSTENKPQESKMTSKELVAMLKEEPQSAVENISPEVLENIDGYVVVRDEEFINIYSYSGSDRSSLKDRTTYSASDYNLRSGYYVSIDKFLDSICNRHEDCKVSFITETGVEIDYNTIKTTLEDLCVEQGGITLENGNDKKDSYFINRRDLRKFLSKFKVKYTSLKIEDNSKVK